MSIRNTYLGFAETALEAIPSLTGKVYRSEVTAKSRAVTPCVVLRPVSDSPQRADISHRLIWESVFAITLLVRSNTPDETADPIVDSIHAAIMTNPGLAGAVDLVPISTDWILEDADETLLRVILQFRLVYQTSISDLTTI